MYGNCSTELTQKEQSTKTTNEPENEEEDNESILSNEDTISEVMSEDTLSNLSDEDRDKNHDLLPQTDLQEQQQPNNVESRQEEEEKSAKQNKVAMAAVTQGEKRNSLEFRDNCKSYVAGYLAYQLIDNGRGKKECLHCFPSAVKNNPLDPLPEEYLQLIKRKQKVKEYITEPSHSLYKLVQACERVFDVEVVIEDKLPTQSNLATSLTKKVIRRVESSKLFPGLEDHLSTNKTHREYLVRKIVNRYFLFRIRSYTRLYTMLHIPNISCLVETNQRKTYSLWVCRYSSVIIFQICDCQKIFCVSCVKRFFTKNFVTIDFSYRHQLIAKGL